MVTAKQPRRHTFVERTSGSEFVGPPTETCHWCGCDPRNEIHLGQPLAPKRPKRPTLAELEFRLADLRVELANANGRLEIAEARATAALTSVKALVDLTDRGAFAWPDEQAVINTARALVTDGERLSPANERWLASKARR